MLTIEQKIRPIIKPYAFVLKTTNPDSNDILEVCSWIFTNICPYDESRIEFRAHSMWSTAVYFKYEDDATAFKLRWL